MEHSNFYQMIKNITPYMNPNIQRNMGIFLQYIEFQNSIHEYHSPQKEIASCEIPEGSTRQMEILRAIRPCCNQKEQELLDHILNFITISETIKL